MKRVGIVKRPNRHMVILAEAEARTPAACSRAAKQIAV
jgi:hypothetical protein